MAKLPWEAVALKMFLLDQTSDGGYIVAGGAQINDGDVTGNHGGGGLSGSSNLIAAVPSQWQKSLGGTEVNMPVY
ncbi:MAG: hypothetical protein WKG06_13935 [Segetibacter sp.]